MIGKILAAALITLTLLVSGSSALAGTYTVTDLGTLSYTPPPLYPPGEPFPGGNPDSEENGPYDINDAGQMVLDGLLYSNGSVQNLGTLPGGTYSVASGVNNAGQVVGYADTVGGAIHAFLYSKGVIEDLGTLPGGTYSAAYRINDAGQVVGYATQASGADTLFLYSGGVMTDTYIETLLGSLCGNVPDGCPYPGYNIKGINNAGQVVGQYWGFSPSVRSFIYSGGNVQDLGTLALPGNPETFAHAINNAGQVVGFTGQGGDLSGGPIAFLYNKGSMQAIGPVIGDEGFPTTYAFAVNDRAQVVGTIRTLGMMPESDRAFLYSNGQMTDLNSLLSPSSGWTLMYPYGINNMGQIVGVGMINGGNHYFLLTPEAGIVACNGITLSGNAIVDSYNSTNGTYASQVGAGGHAGNDGNVQTRGAGANITLSGDTAIYGNASATGSVITSGYGKVYGTTSQNQPVSACDPLNVVNLVQKNKPSSGTPASITLSGTKTETLSAPGSFYLSGITLTGQSTLTVSGSGNATMFIDGNLSISGQASLIVPNGVTLTIYITGNISIAGNGITNQGASTDLIIYASGSKGTQVAISGNSDLGGALYAPLSNISVTGNSAIMGAVRGMTVTGSGNAGFHYDEAATNLLLGW
jgi:probable HAF family extracellular repeat protein